jgi:molybdopterin molybdotransferase
MELGFWRIAMRPGKPLMHGRIGDMRILGLPGNPVSAIVCGVLFLVPLVRALSGDADAANDRSEIAILAEALPANDSRQDYMRAHIVGQRDGHPLVEAFGRQDSSMLRVLAEAECLIIRDAHAPAAAAGDACRMMRL